MKQKFSGRKLTAFICTIAMLLTTLLPTVNVFADTPSSNDSTLINLALNKPAVATSTQGSYTANEAFDGIDHGSNEEDNTNRWAADWGHSTASIYVDLGTNYNVTGSKISWEYSYATKYQILVAQDGSDPTLDSSWTQVFQFDNDSTGNIVDETATGGSITRNDDNVGRMDTVTLNSTVKGRYVKISETDVAVNGGTKYPACIYEAYVYGSEIPVNLALNKPAFASSVQGEAGPALAFNGLDHGSYPDAVPHSDMWGANWGDAAGAWIYVDLGASYKINNLKLSWEFSYATAYHIQVAPYGSDPADNKSYTTIFTCADNGATKTEGTITRTDDGQGEMDIVTLDAMATGEYVRVVVDDVVLYDQKYPPGIYEMEIYGQNSPLLNPNGFIDDLNDFSKTLEHSENLIIDSTSPSNFNGDLGRAAKSVSDEVYLTYHTDYDIQLFTIDTLVNSNEAESVTEACYASYSTNGDIYIKIDSIEKFNTPINASKEWPLTEYYANVPAGARYLKIVLPTDANNTSSSFELSRIVINNAVAPVSTNPGPAGKFDGSQDVSLTSATDGAAIKYVLSSDPTSILDYTAPIHLTATTTITAYAKKAGLLNSLSLSYTYVSKNDEKVDKYGQLESATFDQTKSSIAKVTSDQDLVNDVTNDASYYAGLNPAARDEYGGLPGSKTQKGLQETGYFHTEKLNGKFVMVDPLGNLYFSIGVNGVGYSGDTYTQVTGRETTYNWIPKLTQDQSDPDNIFQPAFLGGSKDYFSYYIANRIKKTGAFDQTSYYTEMVNRLKKWGFNSEGGFSNRPDSSVNNTNFPQVQFADLPSNDMISDLGMFDIYKANVEADIDAAFVSQGIAAHVDDPLIIGYFFGNEYPYHLFKGKITNEKASQVATKGALVDMLRTKYNNAIDDFNTAWGDDFTSFDDMLENNIGVNTEIAASDMNEFMAQYLEKFYKTISQEFKKYDNKHMLMGDRYLANAMNDSDVRALVCTAAGKYMDVLSYNYYTYDIDINRIQAMSTEANKPLIFTEFMYTEPSEGQTGGVRTLDNETQKGLAYRNYVEKSAASGVVVGAHWFEYLDESTTGRWFQGYEGESFACGLLNVADRPYKTMMDSVMATNNNIYDVELGNTIPYSYDFGPGRTERTSANNVDIKKATAPIVIDGDKDSSWPDTQVLALNDDNRVGGQKDPDIASNISLAWDNTNLYVFAHVKDSTPMNNAFADGNIWNGDALEMFVGPSVINVGGSLKVSDTQLILSGGPTPVLGAPYYWYNNKQTQPVINMVTKADTDGYNIEAAIPLSGLNISDAADGRQLKFDIGFDNGIGSSRAAQYMWNGGDNNNQSRDKWGIATLVSASATVVQIVPIQASTPTVIPEPLIQKDGSVKIEITPVFDAAKQTAVAKLSSEILSKAIEKAVVDVKGIKKVTVELAKVENAKTYLLELPTNTLSSSAADLKVEIKTPLGTVTVPSNMFVADSAAKSTNIGISIGIADTSGFDNKVKAAIGNRPVIELNASVDGKVVAWNNPDARVMVSIDYKPTPKELENKDFITVWCIDGTGKVIAIPSGKYDPVTGKVTFTTTHFSKYAIVYVEKTFSDLGKYQGIVKAVETLASKGIIEGTTEAAFSPDKNVTRGEFVTWLLKTLGLTAKFNSNFDDVKSTDKDYEALGIAKTLGIAMGVGKNKFSPEKQISRQDMIVLTCRALKASGRKLDIGTKSDIDRFSDALKVAKYAAEDLQTMVKAGLIKGSDKKLKPTENTIRAEAVQLIYRIYIS